MHWLKKKLYYIINDKKNLQINIIIYFRLYSYIRYIYVKYFLMLSLGVLCYQFHISSNLTQQNYNKTNTYYYEYIKL